MNEIPFASGTSPFHITSSLIYNPFDNPNTTFYGGGGKENDEERVKLLQTL